MRRNDGTTFPTVVTANLLEQYGEPFIVVGFQDLSDQTKRIKAEQTALAKSRFLDHMSHEVRTPLNGMLGIADLLLETELTEKQREFVDMSRVSGQQLLAIVNNILDFSVIDEGTLKLQKNECDWSNLLESQLKIFRTLAAERQVDVVFSLTIAPGLPRRILCDEKRLRQVLFNLLDNSLKFTPRGNVAVRVTEAPTTPESFRKDDKDAGGGPIHRFSFEVTDTGVGISKEKLANLFEAFTLGDASFSRKYGGTGLGLAISRALILKMNGEIIVESETDVGSTFRFTLPFEAAEERTPPENEPVTKKESPKSVAAKSPDETRILVVEDNRIHRIVTGEILKKPGFLYEFAEDGLQGCEAIATKPYDLVLMDCQMPVMDGFDATKRIRAMEAGVDEWKPTHQGRIPIIALTANALPGDEKACYDAGMDDFCSKPANAVQLLEAISKWIPLKKSAPVESGPRP